MYWDTVERVEHEVIAYAKQHSVAFSRFALFLVYFWFGILKVLGQSPASQMVLRLQHLTIPSFISNNVFMVSFGLFEVLIGVLFLMPRTNRIGLVLMAAHMVMTALPLFLLPHMVWTGWFVPTLEGQYIIKNVALIAAALSIAAQMVPMRSVPR